MLTTASSSRASSLGHLGALDGLRFIAASCVLVAHGFFYLVLEQNNQLISPYNAPLLGLNTIGMTLFFTLSGFVIHYNYAASLSRPGGKRRFAVARFARLYPLFLLIFVVEMYRAFRHPERQFDLIGPLPLFLTFTESWWFWSFGTRVATEAYSNATDLMWSLSTEAFFYLVYVPLAPLLRRLSGTMLLIVGATIAAGIAWATDAAQYHAGTLNSFALQSTANPQTAGQFTHWLTFNSPWVRLPEFLLGALAAQHVMTSAPSETRSRVVCAAALAIFVPAYMYTNITMLPISGVITTGLAFTFALLLASTATSSHLLARALSNRWMLLGGAASYSLYLLQYWVMHDLGHRLADGWSTGIRFAVFLLLLPVAAIVSYLSYRYFERPAMRLVRRMLSGGYAQRWVLADGPVGDLARPNEANLSHSHPGARLETGLRVQHAHPRSFHHRDDVVLLAERFCHPLQLCRSRPRAWR
ncbi:MAG TPA: acyltransferase [Stellaceae bacterium]|nr:acyltransferase [Stellaceae bacterium]